MQSPGAPVMRPVTSAAKPAEPSCAVRTNSTPPLRIASISGSTLPLGMPKPRVDSGRFQRRDDQIGVVHDKATVMSGPA